MAKSTKPGKGGAGGGGGAAEISFKAKPKKKKTEAPKEKAPEPRMKRFYLDTIRPALKAEMGYGTDLACPRITKVVVSMGVGDAAAEPKKLETLLDDVETITGQRPTVTRARLSVANFKLRQGMPNGLKVTLRRSRMWEFLDRLIAVVIPRMRDFRGLSPKAFDGRGNYSMGLTDQIVFPEIKADRIEYIHGMNIAVCTTARSDKEALELLRRIGFPFRDMSVMVMGSKEKK